MFHLRSVHAVLAAAAIILVAAPAVGQIDPTGRTGGKPADPAKPATPANPAAPGNDFSLMKPEGPSPTILGLKVPNATRSDDLTPAVAALNRMVDAYRNAPALVEEVELVQFFMDRSKGVINARVILGEGTDAMIQTPSSRMMTIGDRFYYEEPERFQARYVDVPLKTDILVTASESLSSQPAIAWQVRSRIGANSGELMHALALGVPDPTSVTGYERAVLPDGTPVERITMSARSGWSIVTLDSDTGLVRAIDADYKPPGTPIDSFRVSVHVRTKSTISEELAEPLAFVPGSREAVIDIGQLRGISLVSRPVAIGVKIGDVVPAFEGLSVEGEAYDVRARLGRIQVLVFWNLQTVGFLSGAPRVTVLGNAARERDGVPVDVIMVNSLERTEDEQKWDEVFDYWKDERFGVPTLFDDSDEIARTLGITQIPTTVVIDQYGRLVGAQGAMEADWTPKVTELIERASLAAPPKPGG
ncbi:MAG: TlpA family protein disulfide reductase [Phycisphaerales bacterium]